MCSRRRAGAAGVFEEFGGGRQVTQNFPMIPCRGMLKYGSDKPDLRNPLVIADVTEEFSRDDVSSMPSRM